MILAKKSGHTFSQFHAWNVVSLERYLSAEPGVTIRNTVLFLEIECNFRNFCWD
jgi:hypothetical protein